MHPRLPADFLSGRLHLPLRPALQRFPAQMPHLFDHPLLGRVGLPQIAVRILHCESDRRHTVTKVGMPPQKRHQCLIAQIRALHLILPRSESDGDYSAQL